MRKLKVAQPRRSERIIWREILRDKESRFTHRLHGVLTVCRGSSCYDVAAFWGKSPRTVEYWVRRFSEEGIAGLQERPRSGRPPRIPREHTDLLRADLGRSPLAFGIEQRYWTGRVLQHHLARSYAVRLGVRQCQRLIRGLKGTIQPSLFSAKT